MGVLNFSTDNLITGVNIIDGNLYWTDNLNEPKKLEIDRFRDYDHTSPSTNIRGEQFNESDITVIRMHPWKPIILELEEYNPTDAERLLKPNPPFENIFPRFSYRWKFEDGQYSPYAPFTQAAFLPKSRTLTGYSYWDNSIAYNQNAVVNFEGEAFKANAYIPQPTAGSSNPQPPNSSSWDFEGSAVYSSEEANYIEGYNTTMFNNVGKITLKDIPRGPRDAVAVDLLYTESISSTIYVIETIDIPVDHRGKDFIIGTNYSTDTSNGRVPNTGEPRYPQDYSLLPLRYQLSARKIYSALPANQLSRPYDEVPHKAKAQEITANRLIYGNYEIGFDQPSSLRLNSTFVSAGSGDGLNVKGNRSYEIGVAYIDAYGRQGAMLQAGSITNTDGSVEEAIPLSSNFNQATRQQIQATITSKAPDWADRYRYFIKDPSTDYHSLISYNIYNDGGPDDVNSEFVWVEFQSTDRNKIQEASSSNQGTVLALRRDNDNIAYDKNRFLVQDIQNEAPEDVKIQSKETISNTVLFKKSTMGGDSNTEISSENNTFSGIATGDRELLYTTENQRIASIQIFVKSIQPAINDFIETYQPEDIAFKQPLIDFGEPAFGIAGTPATVDTTKLTSSLYLRFRKGNEFYVGEDQYVKVLQISNEVNAGGNQTQSLITSSNFTKAIQFTLGERYTYTKENGLKPVTVIGATGETEQALGMPGSISDWIPVWFELYASEATQESIERLSGKFFVKTSRKNLKSKQSLFSFDGKLEELSQVWFETEPVIEESNLDLFWEASDTFCVCTEHGCPNNIPWFNSVAEVNNDGVYLETTRIFNKFNTVQLVNGVKVNVPTDRNAIVKRPYGLTWSGIYNGRTDTNRLNQFITADGITKELEPNYGSLQLLHARDTNLIAACEDKIFRILADKDLLYNADGSGNISASNMVLGQTTPFVGEYGISTNPESFASYGSSFWITDKNRGVVLQVTPANGQIFEISSAGMKDHFRDRLHSADKLIGAYDDYSNAYVLSIQGYNQNDPMIDLGGAINAETSNITWKYEPAQQGWTSRVSFIPENGLSMNNKFYTYKNGKLFLHNSCTVPRNHFYNLPVKADPNNPGSFLPASYASEVEVILNDNASTLKDFLTLGYEGTAGWVATSIYSESEDLVITNTWPFVKKEDKYFAPIVGQINTYGLTDSGLGSVTADDGSTIFISGTQDKSGVKGFYNKVRLQYPLETKAELFSINSENVLSSN